VTVVGRNLPISSDIVLGAQMWDVLAKVALGPKALDSNVSIGR